MTIYLHNGEKLEYAYNVVFGLDIVEVMFTNNINRVVSIKDIEKIKN